MTHDRDLERILDNWLADGPTQVADRVIDEMASRIARQPQRPAWRLRPWRFPTMSTQLRLAAILGALLIAALAGAVLLSAGGGGSSTPGVGPTPTPIVFRSGTHLAAGTYEAQLNAGQLTFTLPPGWSSADISAFDFTLHRDAGPQGDTVKVFTDMRRASKDAACTEAQQTEVGVTADLLGRDLGTDPNLVATGSGPIELGGGLSGQIVDLALAPGVTKTCPFSSGQPSVPLVVDTIPGQGAFWGIGPKERIRLVILDGLRGHNVVVAVDSADGTSFEALVGATMPIVQSFGFEAASPSPLLSPTAKP